MVTRVGTRQIKDNGILREDINTTTPNQSLIRRIIAGVGISLSSTGADTGTGDVTISATENLSFSYRIIAANSLMEISNEQQMSVHGELSLMENSELKIQGELVIAKG
jgi:hypothetical protein